MDAQKSYCSVKRNKGLNFPDLKLVIQLQLHWFRMFLVQLRYLRTTNLRIKWKISSQLAQTPYSAWIFQRNDPSATLSPIAVMKKSCFMWLAAPFLDYVQTILHLTLDSLSILLYPVLFFMRVISGNIFLFLVRFNQ